MIISLVAVLSIIYLRSQISIVLPHRNYHDREDLEPRISRMSQIAIAKHRCNPCHPWLAFWLRLEAALWEQIYITAAMTAPTPIPNTTPAVTSDK